MASDPGVGVIFAVSAAAGISFGSFFASFSLAVRLICRMASHSADGTTTTAPDSRLRLSISN